MTTFPIIPALEPWRRRLYLPAYQLSEAAKLCEITLPTVARWHYGFPGERQRRRSLSYLQLVEVAFVATFRQARITLRRIRLAREYLSKVFRVEYPFAQLQLRTAGAHILKDLEELGGDIPKLIVADQYGQEGWSELLKVRFEQFVYEYDFALRWFPRGKTFPIVIDPRIAFGAPIVLQGGIPTWILKERLDAGETPEEVKDDFGVSLSEISAAVEFEGSKLRAA